MKTLDICVPTFNRPKHLLKFLNIIKESKLNNYCEVHITDNASTNKEIQITKVFSEKLNGVYWYKNYANFGGNVNIVLAACHGTAEYFLVSGDDDILLPELAKLTAVLKREKPHLVVLEKSKFENRALGMINLQSLLNDMCRDPYRLNELSHITSIIHKRTNFSYLHGLRNVNSFYPHVWAWLGQILS